MVIRIGHVTSLLPKRRSVSALLEEREIGIGFAKHNSSPLSAESAIRRFYLDFDTEAAETATIGTDVPT